MEASFNELRTAAQAVLGSFDLRPDCNAGSVAVAIRGRSGRIFTGICVHLCCGIEFCAEHAAIAEMLKTRETEIVAMVALVDGGGVVPPCGRCRELMVQIDDRNWGATIMVGENETATLRELLPPLQ